VSTVLTAAGPVILAIEHYVSDPSTGTTNAPTPIVNVQQLAQPGPQPGPADVPTLP
jgi:hypothetical protein